MIFLKWLAGQSRLEMEEVGDMVSPEAFEFGISAMVGAAISLTTSRYGVSLTNPDTRTDALLVYGTCIFWWLLGVDLIFH